MLQYGLHSRTKRHRRERTYQHGTATLCFNALPPYASSHRKKNEEEEEKREVVLLLRGRGGRQRRRTTSERKTKQQTAMINDKNSQRKARLGRSAAPAPSALSRRHCSVAPTQTLAGSFTPDCRSHWCSLTLNWIEHHWRMGKTKSQDASRG